MRDWDGGLTSLPLQTQYDALKKQMEVMEMEVMEARLIRAAEINGEVDDDDTGGSEARGAQQGLSGKLGYPPPQAAAALAPAHLPSVGWYKAK